LEKWIQEVDADSNRSLDLSEFVHMIRIIINCNNVYVFQEKQAYVERTGMQSRPRPAPLKLDESAAKSPLQRAHNKVEEQERKVLNSDGTRVGIDGKVKYSHLKTPASIAKRREKALDKTGVALQAPGRRKGDHANVFGARPHMQSEK